MLQYQVQVKKYQACKLEDEREGGFLSIFGFGKAIKLTKNILRKTSLLVRMIDWVVVKHYALLKNPYCLPCCFYKCFSLAFLTNIRNTEIRICSRYERTRPKKATRLFAKTSIQKIWNFNYSRDNSSISRSIKILKQAVVVHNLYPTVCFLYGI